MVSFLLSLLLPAFAVAQGVVPQAGSTYTISPGGFPNLCLAPSGTSDGSAVVTKDCDTADDIVWTYQNGNLQNSATGLCMDVTNGNTWNGNKMQVWTCFPNNRNQVFMSTTALQNGENIKWSGKGMCLDLTNGQGVVGTQIQIWNCFDHNTNQQWAFVDAEEVDSCDETATNTLTYSSSISASPTTTSSSVSQTTATSSNLGDNLLAGGGQHSGPVQTSTSSYAVGGTTTSTSISASVSTTTSSVSTTTSSASGTGPSGGAVAPGTADFSGYQQTSGTQIVDSNGNNVIWKGVNLGGWLVSEDWMNGITDNSGNGDRFMQNTLESRFGAAQTMNLLNAWYDNFLTSSDWDNVAAMGYNSVRLPFGWRNLQNADGSWILNSNGDIDFSRLDWAVQQAKQRNIVIILVFHIWDTQQQQYSMISENTADGQASRDRAGLIWEKVAAHYLGEPTFAAFDAINEPTGSWGNILQQDLYNSIRSVDPKRIIVMESIDSTNPSQYGWTNVVYSWHEYNCMGDNYGANQATLQSGLINAINTWHSYNIPAYLGEFMADGQTLTYILDQMNSMGISWQSWTYKTVNMGRWGLYNIGTNGNDYVTVSSDSYDSIMSVWSNLGSLSRQAVANQYSSAMTKRDMASPRAGAIKTFSGHSRRSRRGMVFGAHGKKASSF